MNKLVFCICSYLLTISPCTAQDRNIEFGLGIKYDKFDISQVENVFKCNIDMGAVAYISYGQPINEKFSWEAGFATNNYKVNFQVTSPEGTIFSNRELVSVMRSNRLYLNIKHHTKQLNPKLAWVNTAGISLLIGAKNPYDVILERQKSVDTPNGSESVVVNIQTFGLTGSAILLGAGTRLYYQINKEFKLDLNLAFITGLSEISKIEVNYIFGSAATYKKAVFSTSGFAPFLTFGVNYNLIQEKD